MAVNSKNFVLLCITLYHSLLSITLYYSVLLRETLWYSVVKLRLHPSLKKIFLFFPLPCSIFIFPAFTYCTYIKPVNQQFIKKQILGLTVG